MPLSRVHTTAADGTFSGDGAIAWNASHGVTGATSGGIPYFDSATSEASSALLASGGVVLGGGAGGAPNTSANLTFDGTKLTIGNGTATGLVIGAGSLGTPSLAVTGDTAGWFSTGANQWTWATGGNTPNISLISGIIRMQDVEVLGWASGNSTTGADTGISRISAGLIGVGTGAAGSFAGSLKLTDLFTNNAAALIKTNTTLTDQAGAGLGTLTNAPTAGDPTKWIAIDDNGTTRKIPTWT